ncbi:hypothetical protein RhiXN_04735 [Rhizoctonia solani]|uniref:Transmembrane protein n=1 Tax=Rhizoctonia solani TaxID=456999 RepID=A0A8H8NQX2_9AGAM|nr:uncharacterized protein RhiXN_04735 [Rhizoctonia solani]QRW16733.1 hypothetical protein RhiXN_04735 [Rhizoctonia solani]
MLFALPIIVAAVATYIQFAFIQGDEYEWLRPLVWNALEDMKGVMRHHMPSWMYPISAGDPRPTLPAPIPTNSSLLATNNQSLATGTPKQVSTLCLIHVPYETSGWMILHYQNICRTYFFNAICGMAVFLCLAGFVACLVTPTIRDCAQNRTEKPNTASSLVLIPPIDILDFELILPNRPASSQYNVKPNASSSPRLRPTTPESHFSSAVVNTNFSPAATPASVWKDLRISSPVTTSNEMPRSMARHWRRDFSCITSGGPCSCITSLSRMNSEPCHHPKSQMVPQTTTEGFSEPSNTKTVDLGPLTGEATRINLKTGPLEDIQRHDSPFRGSKERDLVAESIYQDSALGNSDIISSSGHDSSVDSTPRAAPRLIGCCKSSIESMPTMVRTSIDPHAEGTSNLASVVSASWAEFITLRSLVAPHLDHLGESFSLDSFQDENAWANSDACGPGPECTGPSPDASDSNDNSIACSGCAEHIKTTCYSSNSIGLTSQYSISTEPDTPLITPSNSMLQVPGSEEPSCMDATSDLRPSMDFVFENQLSKIESSLASPSEGKSCSNPFTEAQPNGSTPKNSDGSLPSRTLGSQTFLDDRTYAEVAGVPSDIESAQATLTLERWRLPHSSSSHSRSHKVPGANKQGVSNWETHGTAASMWARVPDPNSRGFVGRRGRRGRAQIM